MKIFLENFRTVALGRVIGRGPMSLARFFLNRESVSERLLGKRQPCCRFRRDSPAVRLFVCGGSMGGRWRFLYREAGERKVAFSLSGKSVSGRHARSRAASRKAAAGLPQSKWPLATVDVWRAEGLLHSGAGTTLRPKSPPTVLPSGVTVKRMTASTVSP
jgi:hypothetical protein